MEFRRENKMNLLTAENISKSYSEKRIIENIDFGINEGDKIGLIGINGTGKSTLLRMVAGLEQADNGRIIKGSGVVIEYLSQNPYFDMNSTVIEQVFKGNSEIMTVIREYEDAVNNPAAPHERILELTRKMDEKNAWNIENETKSILTKLGIIDFDAAIGNLSGGQRKRIALASALINKSDLLILDEPTNHLDNEAIDWLEQYINNRRGALLMVTHDRYFLDRVVNKIVELDRGNLHVYKGNYSNFLEMKLERQEVEAAIQDKRQNLLRKELKWIKRGAKARTTKQKARIERFEKLNEQVDVLNDEKLEISIAGSRLGKKVIELHNISKSFDQRNLIRDFSYVLLRNDRIGIIGPNGIGKSTLLNIVAGRISPDSGDVEVGETVRIGMYSQETYHIDDNLRIIEYIKDGAEFITNTDGYKISASQMLERFMFPVSLQWTPIAKLSGGEKRRLYLLRVLMEGPNILLLDEPTNDLDIETLMILEDYLDEFHGAVITISHDRYFLDRIAQKIFSFEGNGRIVQYTGNYSDYRAFAEETRKDYQEEAGDRKNENKKHKNTANEDSDNRKAKALKFSYMEQREYEEIDSIIAGIEGRIQAVEGEINMSSSNYERLQELLTEKEKLTQLLEDKMERWVYLNELADRITEERQQ